VNAIKKLRTPCREARAVVEVFALWEPIDTSAGLIQRAWRWIDEPLRPEEFALRAAAKNSPRVPRMLQ
jgi:hypothetical protein